MYVPNLPFNYAERTSKLNEVVNAIIDRREANTTALTAALRGAGGFGKSTLAIAVCADERIKQAFAGGIYWVDLGKNINDALTAEKINHLLEDLGYLGAAYTDYRDASKKLREILLEARVLIVIDDVWNRARLEVFRQGGPNCAHLVTTRDYNTLPLGTKVVTVDSASPEEALQMLRRGLPEGEDELLADLSDKLWNWPLLLGLANGQLYREVHQNQASLRTAIKKAIRQYESRGLTAFDLKDPIERNQAARLALDVSFEQLHPEEEEYLIQLAVFPENTAIPLTALIALWGRTASLEESDVEGLCTQFANASFFQRYDAENKSFRIHAVIREYLDAKLGGEKKKTHRDLVEGYRDQFKAAEWWLVPDDRYYYQHLIQHLWAADLRQDTIELLFNYTWLKTELMMGGVSSVLRDCDSIAESPDIGGLQYEFRLLKDFFRLSAHTLTKDTNQLPSQILGRMLNFRNEYISGLVEQAKQERSFSWLMPSQPYLTPPGESELMTLDGYAPITAMTISADEHRIISGSIDGSLNIWDIESGECSHTLIGHSSRLCAIALTSDGNKAISGDEDGIVKVWDTRNGSCMRSTDEIQKGISSLVITPDGKQAIWSSNDGAVKIWRLDEKKDPQILVQPTGYKSIVALTPNGKRLISSINKTIKIWDIENGICLHTIPGHTKTINAVATSADGKQLASASQDKTIKIWDIDNGTCLQTLSDYKSVSAVTFVANGQQVVSISDDRRRLKIVEIQSGKYLHVLKGHQHDIKALALTPDEKWAITASKDRTIKIWNLETGVCLGTLRGHSDEVNTLVLTQDGKRLFSGAADKTIKGWNLEAMYGLLPIDENQSNVFVSDKHNGPVNSVVQDAHRGRAISASHDKTLKIWEIEGGNCLHTLKGHTKPVNAVTLTPDGKFAISGAGDGVIIIWDVSKGSLLYTLSRKTAIYKKEDKENLQCGINAIAFTPDGTRAVSASKNSVIKIWDVEKHKRLYILKGHKKTAHSSEKRSRPRAQGIIAIALTSDGGRVVSAASDSTLRIWDLRNGKCIRSLIGHTRFIEDVKLTPDGKKAVSASYDAHLRIWDLENGKCLHTLVGHTGPVRAVTLTSDGKWAISASSDRTIRIWDIESGACVRILSGHSDRVNAIALTHDEKRVASAAKDKMIKLWDIETGECLVTYRADYPFYTIAVNDSPPARIIAGDHKGNVHFLRLVAENANSVSMP